MADMMSTTTEDEARAYGVSTIAPGLATVADEIRVSGEDWISAISRAMGTVAMADYQRRLLNVQLERARQGLPPLNASQYGVGVNVEAPQLNLLLIGGLAVAALLLLRRR